MDGRVRTVDIESALKNIRDEKYRILKLDLPAKEIKEYRVGWGALGLIEPINVPTIKQLSERPIYNDKEVKEVLDILRAPPLRLIQCHGSMRSLFNLTLPLNTRRIL